MASSPFVTWAGRCFLEQRSVAFQPQGCQRTRRNVGFSVRVQASGGRLTRKNNCYLAAFFYRKAGIQLLCANRANASNAQSPVNTLPNNQEFSKNRSSPQYAQHRPPPNDGLSY